LTDVSGNRTPGEGKRDGGRLHGTPPLDVQDTRKEHMHAMKNRVQTETQKRQTEKPGGPPARIIVRFTLPARLRTRVDRARKPFGLTRGEFIRRAVAHELRTGALDALAAKGGKA